MEEYIIDLTEVLDIIRSKIKIIMAITLIMTIATAGYLATVPPRYQSQSMLRIKGEKGLGIAGLGSLTGGNGPLSNQTMMSYIAILKSRSVMEPLIAEIAVPDKEGNMPTYEKWLAKHISVNAGGKDSEILRVSTTALTPEEAQKINTLLLANFLKRTADLNREENTTTRKFIEARAAEAKKDLDRSEKSLEKFCSEHRIISIENKTAALAEKTSNLGQQIALNDIEVESAKAELIAINEQLATAGAVIADSITIAEYNKELAKLESLKISFRTKYTEKHPKMVTVNNSISEIKEKIRDEIKKVSKMQSAGANPVQQNLIASKFRCEGIIAVGNAKGKVLAKQSKENDKVIAKLPKLESRYINLSRKVNVASEVYLMLVKRLETAKIEEVMVPQDIQVVDVPTLPTASLPRGRVLKLLIVIIFGFISSSFVLVVKQLWNRTIDTREDVAHYLDLPVWGVIPDETSKLSSYGYGYGAEEDKKQKVTSRRLPWKK